MTNRAVTWPGADRAKTDYKEGFTCGEEGARETSPKELARRRRTPRSGGRRRKNLRLVSSRPGGGRGRKWLRFDLIQEGGTG